MNKSPKRFREFVWAMYDFADTIFSMNIVSLYFPLLIVSDLGAEDIYVGAANSVSQIAVVFLAPLLGTISDRSGKRMSFFITFAAITAVATAAMMFTGKAQMLWGTLIVFFVANLSYQLSLTFYNSLLPRVCSAERWGKVSGLGTALGYVGSIVGMAMVMPFNTGKIFGIQTPIPAMGRTGTFIPTALLFAIFALPTLIYFFRDEKIVSYPADKSEIHPLKKIWNTARCEKVSWNKDIFIVETSFSGRSGNHDYFYGSFCGKSDGNARFCENCFFRHRNDSRRVRFDYNRQNHRCPRCA